MIGRVRGGLTLALAALLAACGAPPKRVEASPSQPERQCPRVEARVEGSGRQSIEPVELHTAAECHWVGRAVGVANQPIRLCFGASGPCYAEAHAERTLVRAGSEATALIEVTYDGFRLLGITELESIQFYPRFRAALSGYHFPDVVQLKQSWRDVSARVDLGGGRASETKHRALSCEALSLVPVNRVNAQSLEAIAQWLKPDAKPTVMELLPKRVPLRIQPESSPVVELQPSDHPLRNRVLLLERRGNMSWIVWDTSGTGKVHGWVPNTALRGPTKLAKPIQQGSSGGAHVMVGHEKVTGYACEKTVPLFASVGRQIRRVGQVFKGTRFRKLGAVSDPRVNTVSNTPSTTMVSITFPDRVVEGTTGKRTTEPPLVRLLSGAALLIRSEDFENCRSSDVQGSK